MPQRQDTPNDPLWAAVPYEAPNEEEAGCGFDLSDYPDIISLGGWNRGGTSLAYRPLGLGRVWLVEADWQDDPDFVDGIHEPSFDLMAAMIAYGHQLIEWPSCFDGLDNDEDGTIDSFDEECASREDDEAGRCAANEMQCGNGCVVGEREIIFNRPPDADRNTTTTHNGVNWYFSEDASIGFAPEGEEVLLNSCDVAGQDDELRMCWHTRNGELNPGYRCGAEHSLNNNWERAIWTRP